MGEGAFRVWVHNSTNVAADLDGGSEVWNGTSARPTPGIRLAAGNVDETDGGGVVTPIDPKSGVRVIRGNHSAAGTDMIRLEIRVAVPIGTLEGHYRVDLYLTLRAETASRSAEYIKVAIPVLLN